MEIAQLEASRDENLKVELLVKRKVYLTRRFSRVKTYHERVWLPLFGALRDLIISEAHRSRYQAAYFITQIGRAIKVEFIKEQVLFTKISLMTSRYLLFSLLLATCSLVFAYDPSPLQDYCVADLASKVRVNGFVCKDPNIVTVEDFVYRGLNNRLNASNVLGYYVTGVTVNQMPGLNTLGISISRIDFAPGGIISPHTVPRATQIMTVIKGSLQVGFVTSNPLLRLFTTVLEKGDVFVIPQGLVHFLKNVGHEYAFAIAAFNSQNPGVITIGNATFASNPRIPGDILANMLRVKTNIISEIEANFQ
ncbi:putative germin-like protein 2-1 [Rutidosis leptorrhynchoides]|uniref:putative germin-like protein 2-1 n=1 Tax=Rutidosis leptorrhynchoides TaxID=125765 RepID=UPI003A9A4A65